MSGWKIVAIIFIILFIVETIMAGLLIKVGMDIQNKEVECSINCDNSEYSSYTFDSSNSVCSCYDYQGVVKYQEIIS